MGVTNTHNFTGEQNQLATYAKALAHPARIAILQYLLKQQTCICSNLVEELPLAQATISQHLKELKAIDLIQGTVEGTSVCYCINKQKWEEVSHIFTNLFSSMATGEYKDSCC